MRAVACPREARVDAGVSVGVLVGERCVVWRAAAVALWRGAVVGAAAGGGDDCMLTSNWDASLTLSFPLATK